MMRDGHVHVSRTRAVPMAWRACWGTKIRRYEHDVLFKKASACVEPRECDVLVLIVLTSPRSTAHARICARATDPSNYLAHCPILEFVDAEHKQRSNRRKNKYIALEHVRLAVPHRLPSTKSCRHLAARTFAQPVPACPPRGHPRSGTGAPSASSRGNPNSIRMTLAVGRTSRRPTPSASALQITCSCMARSNVPMHSLAFRVGVGNDGRAGTG
ncbi:hypothetical protein BDW22DRAFT_1265213 [Trametopsis cervina]|nr:hypothetical protein BDW22DRAFT_1265213 [Trametopsis cervina]